MVPMGGRSFLVVSAYHGSIGKAEFFGCFGIPWFYWEGGVFGCFGIPWFQREGGVFWLFWHTMYGTHFSRRNGAPPAGPAPPPTGECCFVPIKKETGGLAFFSETNCPIRLAKQGISKKNAVFPAKTDMILSQSNSNVICAEYNDYQSGYSEFVLLSSVFVLKAYRGIFLC